MIMPTGSRRLVVVHGNNIMGDRGNTVAERWTRVQNTAGPDS
jgi:hypothetical protein